MIIGKIICFGFCCINLLCWTVAKYLLVNVKEENQEDFNGISDDEFDQGQALENNEIISLSASRAGGRSCNAACICDYLTGGCGHC